MRVDVSRPRSPTHQGDVMAKSKEFGSKTRAARERMAKNPQMTVKKVVATLAGQGSRSRRI